MAKKAIRLPGFTRAQLPHWEYLDGETLTLDGVDRQAATLPSECAIVEIRPESGELYFSINGLATIGSDGYIPEDGAEILGPLSNLNSLTVYSTTANTVAHILYFKEV